MQSEADDLKALREVFSTEAAEQLAVIEETLLGLDTRPDDPDALATIFRAAHTIKGGAAMVDLGETAAFAHGVEEALEVLRSGAREATPHVITLLLSGVDQLRVMVDAGDEPEPEGADARASLLEALAAWREAPAESPPDPQSSDVQGDGSDRESKAPAGEPEPPARRADRALRIEVEKLDRLLEAVGELAVWRRGFARAVASGHDTDALDLEVELATGDRLFDEVRSGVMEMRLVPLGPFFRRLARPVRDLASDSDKQVSLIVDGEEVEVDTAVAERIVDPLTHLVRNAVDHGIEEPSARLALGKPAEGTVTVRASRDAAGLVIEVTDDGAGLSRARLVERARSWGVPHPEELRDAELWELVFRPGFSTAAQVSQLSGRGVGMDAVRRTVEAMRGAIGIQSHEGVGTTVTLRLPVTLAVIQGLEVLVGDDTYILPIEGVERCIDYPKDRESSTTGVLDLEGTAIPIVGLRELFGTPGGDPAATRTVAIVRQGSLTAGLVVDRLLGDAETVVKPLSGRLAGLPGMGGSAVLDDGRVGLVIDVPGLLRWAGTNELSIGGVA